MIKKIIPTISDTARIPLKYSQGSEMQRFELAKQLEKAFLKELDSSRFTSKVPVTTFRRALRKVLTPFGVVFDIDKNFNKMLRGAQGFLIRTEENEDTIKADLYGYSLKLPLAGGQIKDKYTALHEARHLFDKVCNPKLNTIIRFLKYFYDEERKNIVTGIKNKILSEYPRTRNWETYENEIRAELSKLGPDDAVNALQITRSHLKTEINAYDSLLRYMKENPIMNIMELLETKSYLRIYFKFEQKLLLTNKLLKEELAKARARK